MKKTVFWQILAILMVASFALAACSPAAPTQAPVQPQSPTDAPAATAAPVDEGLTFGLILIGPHDDKGWSQATYEGGQYVEQNMPGAKMLYIDNGFGQQGSTPAQLGDKLVSQGAKVVIFNSDAFMDDSNTFAAAHPDVVTIMLSGDQNWTEGENYKNIPNMINIMGKMEYMKEVAGCAAALTTETGKIGFLGPLINDETRRLADSAYLGAKYCWTNVLNKDVKDLTFEVTWIGNWFNIPGQTLDPTQVSDQFYNSGHDVVISGIDTTEALVEAKKLSDAGKTVFAVPYDFHGACEQAPSVCLGVPYFNWGPSMLENMQAIKAGTWTPHFEWNGPDWANFNAEDTGAVGFNYGPALTDANKATLEQFVSDLGDGLNLWTGPMNLQDGTTYLKDGEVATDQQIWYAPQLLEGMLGKSE